MTAVTLGAAARIVESQQWLPKLWWQPRAAPRRLKTVCAALSAAKTTSSASPWFPFSPKAIC